ncbi:MAG: hypothetical protein WA014_00915 [Minisyncoccia bacterium]
MEKLKSRIIGIDLDDVIIRTYEGFCIWHNAMYGTSFHWRDIKEYHLENLFDCSRAEIAARCLSFFGSQTHADLQPVSGAVSALSALSRENRLIVITSRPERVRNPTLALMKRHVPFLTEVHFLGHYHDQESSSLRTKGEVCKDHNIDVFVDDALHHVESVTQQGIPVFVLDAPWNQGVLPPAASRVYSWEEILTKLA